MQFCNISASNEVTPMTCAILSPPPPPYSPLVLPPFVRPFSALTIIGTRQDAKKQRLHDGDDSHGGHALWLLAWHACGGFTTPSADFEAAQEAVRDAVACLNDLGKHGQTRLLYCIVLYCTAKPPRQSHGAVSVEMTLSRSFYSDKASVCVCVLSH